MQGSFEKRVQEKLDELRLTPSEPVWKNIEKELKPEKRRRFPFWIPFVIILLSGTAWWMLEGSREKAASVPTVVTTPPVLSKEAETITTSEPGITKERKIQQTNSATPFPAQVRTAATGYKRNRDKAIRQQNTLLPDQNAEAGRITAFKNQIQTVADNAEPEKSSLDQAGNDVNVNQKNISGKTPSQRDVQPQSLEEKSVLVMQQPSVDKPEENTMSLNDSTAKTTDSIEILPLEKKDSAFQKTKVAAKKRWQKMITVKGGWSQFSDGILGGNQRLSDFSSSPAPGNYNGVAGSPSPIKKGAAFQAGIGMSKAIHSRWNVAIGLQYAYYSTQTKVGTYKTIDTTVMTTDGKVALEGYYSNTNMRDFTMRYGLLELPVSIGFKPLARFPLLLSAGASYGRLLHSNALQYNRWANIYYADKDALRKNLFAGFASLQFAFINRATWQLEAGPVVQYHLSGLQNNSTKPQLFFAGLQSTIRF